MKIYYKTKILINGIFPLVNYKIDGFVEKTGKYDETIIDASNDDYIFYSSGFLLKGLYSCKEKEGNFYEYFENDELIEKDIPNNISKNELESNMMREQFKVVDTLQKKIRLLSGLGINLPVFKTTIYNSKKDFYTFVSGTIWSFTHLDVRDYDETLKQKLEQRLKWHIADSTIEELENKNSRFKRAIDFYNNSFSLENIGIRFTLLFSALESLFNITGKKVKKEVSDFASKILFLSSNDRENSKYKIKTYYEERSKFIHGNDDYMITAKIEKDLRDYVREILLIYWNISIIYKVFDAEEIKNIILNNDENTIDIQVQLFVKYLRTSPEKFKDLYEQIKTNFLNKDYKILNNEKLNIK